MPELPGLLIVLHDKATVQDLEILDLARRQFVNRSGITTEAAELWGILGRVLLEGLLVGRGDELIGAASVSGGELRIAPDRLVIGEVANRVVALQGKASVIDVNNFCRGHETSRGEESNSEKE